MVAALSYLKSMIASISKSQAIVILLQEMVESDLRQIGSTPWVRAHFAMTDCTSSYWDSSSYGTITLLDRRLSVKRVSRLKYISEYLRDGLFVDLAIHHTQVFRLCNTHLDSMASNPPLRPLQMKGVAKWLHSDDVYAGILAGDMNANRPLDQTLPHENAFKDAYLELGGREDAKEGCIWGFQSQETIKKRFGPARLDKVLYCGEVTARSLERIEIGVTVDDECTKKKMREEAEIEWVTDHYGLMVEFKF
ncbi:hypothetical protein AOQ84DRAFT_426435, partial [Glonium stellatum]